MLVAKVSWWLPVATYPLYLSTFMDHGFDLLKRTFWEKQRKILSTSRMLIWIPRPSIFRCGISPCFSCQKSHHSSFMPRTCPKRRWPSPRRTAPLGHCWGLMWDLQVSETGIPQWWNLQNREIRVKNMMNQREISWNFVTHYVQK